MSKLSKLTFVFEDTRRLLDAESNDFVWSSWQDRADALREIDEILSALHDGVMPNALTLQVLFAPTGPIQEVSLSSGWGNDFLELARRFDDAISGDEMDEKEHHGILKTCGCVAAMPEHLTQAKELGMDSRFAEVSILVCGECGQHWVRYFCEEEAFTGSGRWYLGAITPEQFSTLTVEEAKSILERLDWYYRGGSYYDGKVVKVFSSGSLS